MDFQLQPNNQGISLPPTLGGAWGLRFGIFSAIFSTVICVSYCPLSSELVFQCHDLEAGKELPETSPPSQTRHVLRRVALSSSPQDRHAVISPQGAALLGHPARNWGPTEEKRSPALNTGQVRRLERILLLSFLSFLFYMQSLRFLTHIFLSSESQVSNVSEDHGLFKTPALLCSFI